MNSRADAMPKITALLAATVQPRQAQGGAAQAAALTPGPLWIIALGDQPIQVRQGLFLRILGVGKSAALDALQTITRRIKFRLRPVVAEPALPVVLSYPASVAATRSPAHRIFTQPGLPRGVDALALQPATGTPAATPTPAAVAASARGLRRQQPNSAIRNVIVAIHSLVRDMF
jgi:hypothetical protein